MRQIILIYDQDCYLCSNFQAYLALKKSYDIQFVDFNTHPDLVKSYAKKGYDIQRGMILDIDGILFQWEQAVMKIQTLIHGQTWFDKVLAYCMKTPWLVKVGYPIASAVRKILLLWPRHFWDKKPLA